MARKKAPPEHENLERWMVSYADFMTLLFATFVVLYALSQLNVSDFKEIEESIKKAFSSATSIMQGTEGLLIETGKDILDSSMADSMIESLFMEYISPKYEQESFEQIKKEIDKMKKDGELEGVNVTIDSRGLVIRIDDNNILFASGSAELSDTAKARLDKIGRLIVQKFAMHIIKVEGHTDNVPAGGRYPSNWELSAARSSSIVRYLINKFKILPEMFTVVGYADTRPAEPNKPNKAKDRRVEIIVQRNNLKNLDHYQNTFMNMSKEEQLRRRNEQIQILKQLENGEIVGLDEDVKHYSGIAQPGKNPTASSNDFIEETKRINKIQNAE